MKLQYSLNAADYLNYQLYTASKSKNTGNRRRRNRFILPVLLIALGLFPRFDFTEVYTLVYILIAIAWLFLYPLWEREMYKDHYKKHINENYRNEVNRLSTLEFTESTIISKDENSESQISYIEFEHIAEVPSALYLKLISSQSVKIPKNKVGNVGELKIFLQNLSENIGIGYREESDWKWK